MIRYWADAVLYPSFALQIVFYVQVFSSNLAFFLIPQEDPKNDFTIMPQMSKFAKIVVKEWDQLVNASKELHDKAKEVFVLMIFFC